jgi:hypothetical protein
MPWVTSRRKFFLPGQHALRFRVGSRCDHDFKKDFGQCGSRRSIEKTVERDDASVCGDRIASQCTTPGVQCVFCHGDAAWVRCFTITNRGLLKLAGNFKCRVGIVEIIVAQLLALELGCVSNSGRELSVTLEGGLLMRVLSVGSTCRSRPEKAIRSGNSTPIFALSQDSNTES